MLLATRSVRDHLRAPHELTIPTKLLSEPIAAPAGAQKADTIKPDDRYPGIVRREATDVAASRCRRRSRRAETGGWAEAIVSSNDYWSLNAATPILDHGLVNDASSSRPESVAPLDGEQ